MTRLLGELLSERITHKADVPPESHESEKSIWEYYNEMAAVEDNIQEVEWRDLADTVYVQTLSTVHLY